MATPGQGPMGVTKLPQGVSPEMMLSLLGITGPTAYFGMTDLGQPKAGDTVLVSGGEPPALLLYQHWPPSI